MRRSLISCLFVLALSAGFVLAQSLTPRRK